MTFNPDPEKLATLLQAVTLADEAIRLMICDELSDRLPGMEEAEAEAAAELRDALAALQAPLDAISALERDIARADGECSSFAAQLADGDISARIAARAALEEWTIERDTLRAKLEQIELDLFPLTRARDEAKARLADIQDDIRRTEFNASSPDYAYVGFGPKTASFFQWTFWGMFTRVLLKGDKGGHLWDEAFAAMDFLALRSGYRTENRDLPSEADHYRKFWQDVYDRANPPEPASFDVREIAQGELIREASQEAAHRLSARMDAAVAAEWRGDRRHELERRVTPSDPAKEWQPLRSVRT
jgi:hypothetical protein